MYWQCSALHCQYTPVASIATCSTPFCEKQQKHYLKGNNAFFKSQDKLIEAASCKVDEFRFRYRFLSNHTHSYPMGFYRMAEIGHGTGVESKSEVECSGMWLTWATECLEKAKNGFAGLFSSQP